MTRLAFLGLGAASRALHLPACRSVPGLEVVGGADPEARARDAFQKSAGPVPVFEDGATLLKELAPDWVLVATPAAFHRDLCELALRHGAHVFCEKPFVETVADADGILAAAHQAGRQVAVNHEFPAMPIHAALIQAAQQATHGRPLFLQAWQTVQLAAEDQSGWRSEWKTMQEFGSHVVDLAMQVFGGLPTQVTARMPRPAHDRGDLVDLVVLEFAGGGSTSIVLDRICPGRHRYLDLRLDTERACLRSSIGGRLGVSLSVEPTTRRPSLEVDLAKGGMAWIERESGRQVLVRNPGNVFADATGRHLSKVLEAVAQGQEPPGSARQARAVVRVVQAAYESATTGRTVTLGDGDA